VLSPVVENKQRKKEFRKTIRSTTFDSSFRQTILSPGKYKFNRDNMGEHRIPQGAGTSLHG